MASSQPYVDPTNQSFVDTLVKTRAPKFSELSYVDARAALEELQKHTPAKDVEIDIVEIPFENGSFAAHIYRPSGSTEHLRAAFYLHGGGWVLGSPNTHDRLVRDLVRESGLAYVFPYYTPAPDAQYPIQLEQAYAALKFIADNGNNHRLKTDAFAAIGDSAGGHMAIALAAMSYERSGPKIVYQVLLYPVTDLAHESQTYKTYFNGPGLDVGTLRYMVDAWIPNKSDRTGPLASPLNAGDEFLSKLPPTLIVVADVDPLREEGEAFGRALQGAGVPTTVFRAEGQMHDFAMINALAISPGAQATIELAALRLKKALA